MPKLSIGTIRSRLMIGFILVVVLATATISSITLFLGSRDGRQRVGDQLQSVASLKQSEIESWVNWLKVNLNLVISAEENQSDVHVLETSSQDSPAYQQAHAKILARFNLISSNTQLFDELFLMDANGTVRVSTSPAFQFQQHSIEDYFIQGLKGQFVGQPSFSLSFGEMMVVVSAPVIEQGMTVGVLAGRASLQSLNSIMLERTGLGNTGETYLVGSNFRLLTSSRNQNFTVPDSYINTDGTGAAITHGQNGFSTYLNYAGERVIGVYRWEPALQVAILAEQQEAEALHSTRVVLATVGLIAVFSMIFAVLAARLLTRSITRPLGELVSTATLISQGDLTQMAKVERDDEVGALATAFNMMTARLKEIIDDQARRSDKLRSVNDIGRHTSAILQVDDLLKYVATSLQNTFGYHDVRIFLMDEHSGNPVLKFSVSLGEVETGANNEPGQIAEVVSSVARTGEASVVNGIACASSAPKRDEICLTRSELAVPIKIGEKVTGVLQTESLTGFNDLDLFIAQTLSDQLAVAIENARLYGQAKELATIQERTRLARDLHDAVSQTLFSASLIADVLPKIWDKNQDEGRKRLEEIRQLTRGALAEMRTLLFELRPAALADADLANLIKHLADSFIGRHRVPVEVNIEESCPLPPDVKVGLYRIAQEALNNIGKHARATRVHVSLICRTGETSLKIEDNGTGFDLSSMQTKSLGLGIMKERAKDIGAKLSISSSPGTGTTISLKWTESPNLD